MFKRNLCSGSAESVGFWTSRIRIWIRLLFGFFRHEANKNLDFELFFDFLIACYFEDWCKCTYCKHIPSKTLFKISKIYFLLASDEKSGIRSRIRIRNPVYGFKDPNPDSKRHGSGTLKGRNLFTEAWMCIGEPIL